MNITGLNTFSGIYVRTGNQTSQGENSRENPELKQASNTLRLSEDQLMLVQKLKLRDTQVRQHEQAHMTTAGGLATSGPSFSYQQGPNGVSYAIGGEVGIDTSPGKTPEETISKAERIRSAALAPADPSSQDLAVAAKASQMEQQALKEASVKAMKKEQAIPKGHDTDSRQSQVNQYYTQSDSKPDASIVSTYA